MTFNDRTHITNKEIWAIALPIMLGNMAQTIINFTDTAFLGHVGVIALGASMLAGLFYFVFTTIATGFAIGIQIIVARRFGEGRLERIGVIFEHGSIVVMILGLILFSILYFFSDALLLWLIDSPNIYEASLEYIKYRRFGIIFVCFNFLFRGLYIGIANTKVITYSTIIMAIVNIFLDYCLIFGNFGFPKMGIGGAALASFFAEVSAFIFFTAYTYFSLRKKEYGIFKLHKIESELMKRILKIATPTMIQKLFSFSVWFIFFILIEKMGETATGISSIVRSIYMILITPGFAFATTTNTVVSRIIGEGYSNEVFPTINKILKNCLLCTIPIMILVAIFPVQIAKIYTNDLNLIQLVIPSIYVICFGTIFQGIGNAYFEAVSGTGNTTAALYLEAIILVVYVAFIWAMTHLTTEVHWVWTAEILYGVLLGLFCVIYLKHARWDKKKI
ncbi:MAG: MATE family efflux transporter [Lentimicrobiaceae bacterium]|nr:MATE family efflux transporter [Lentimicrobiaceae bacterium]